MAGTELVLAHMDKKERVPVMDAVMTIKTSLINRS